MTKKQIHEVVFKRGDGKEIVVHANFNEEGARRYYEASTFQHELRSREVEMFKPLTGEYHLPQGVQRTIAEWLVRNGGAHFEQLDAYDGELKEGLFQHWFEREDVDYDNDAYHPTTKDLSFITELVSRATVVVVLPEHIDDDNLQHWYEDGTRMGDLA